MMRSPSPPARRAVRCPPRPVTPARGTRRPRPGRRPTPSGGRPPIAPTVPSSPIVPVTAMFWPPVSSPGVNSSIRVSVNANPADGPPIAAGVDVELERQLDPLRVEGQEADDRPVRFVGRRRQLDRDGELADVGPLELDLDRVTGFLVGERSREIVHVAQRRAVDLEQPVTRIEHLVGGARLEALRALVVGDEAHHLADQHIARHDRHVVPDGLQAPRTARPARRSASTRGRTCGAAAASGSRTSPPR